MVASEHTEAGRWKENSSRRRTFPRELVQEWKVNSKQPPASARKVREMTGAAWHMPGRGREPGRRNAEHVVAYGASQARDRQDT